MYLHNSERNIKICQAIRIYISNTPAARLSPRDAPFEGGPFIYLKRNPIHEAFTATELESVETLQVPTCCY